VKVGHYSKSGHNKTIWSKLAKSDEIEELKLELEFDEFGEK